MSGPDGAGDARAARRAAPGSPTASTSTSTRVRATVLPEPLGGVAFVARGSSDNAAVYGRYLAELAGGRPRGAGRTEPAHALRRAASTTAAGCWSRSASRARRPRSSTCASGCGRRAPGRLRSSTTRRARWRRAAEVVDRDRRRAPSAPCPRPRPSRPSCSPSRRSRPRSARCRSTAATRRAPARRRGRSSTDIGPARRWPRAWTGPSGCSSSPAGCSTPAALEAALKVKETARHRSPRASPPPISATARSRRSTAMCPALVLDDCGPAADDVRELVAALQHARRARGALRAGRRRAALPTAPRGAGGHPGDRPRPAAGAGAGGGPRARPRRAGRAVQGHGNALSLKQATEED